MNGKTGTILMLAIVCGLGAMYGVQKLVAKREAPTVLRDVLVAARDLKVEEVLKEDMLKVVQMPTEQVPANAFASPTEVAGRWVQIRLLEGEVIVEPKLAPKDLPPGLIGRIPAGMRAFAIEVNEQSGVSGFILPDHHVDVIQAQTESQRGTGLDGRATTILQNVRVLAAGQVTARPEDKSIVVRTVTLAVSPDQVEVLVAARSRGPLSLALRAINDDEVVVRKEPEPEIKEEPKPKPPPTPPPVVMAPPPPVRPRPRYTVIYHGIVGKQVIPRNPEPLPRESGAMVGLGLPRPRGSAE